MSFKIMVSEGIDDKQNIKFLTCVKDNKGSVLKTFKLTSFFKVTEVL